MKSGDEHYTPQPVYDAVKRWLYPKIAMHNFVRPFYPGGDYERFDYSEDGTVVVDNPPFSKLSEIVDFYIKNDVPFFLFAPGLMTFNILQRGRDEVISCVITRHQIVYESGLSLPTSFVTNIKLSDSHTVILAGTLDEMIAEAQQQKAKKRRRNHERTVKNSGEMRKYVVPGKDICVRYSEVLRYDVNGTKIFGSGIRLDEPTVARLEARNG